MRLPDSHLTTVLHINASIALNVLHEIEIDNAPSIALEQANLDSMPSDSRQLLESQGRQVASKFVRYPNPTH